MRLSTLSWLVVRELWISYRLLAILGALLASGIAQALLPGAFPAVLGVGLAAACAVAGFVAAGTVAAERRRGTAGWLIVRAVPRAHLAIAWFAGILPPVVLGLAAAVTLGWLAGSANLPDSVGMAAYAGVSAAALGAIVACAALGLLVGALVPAGLAGPTAATLAGLAALAGLVAGPAQPLLPAAGFGLMQGIVDLTRPLSDGLESLGMSLALTAVLVALTGAALEARDL
jgi:hypothetical protein